MAERIAYLEAVIGADITSFRRGMRDVRNEMGVLSETVGGIGGMARTATFAVSAPLFAFGTFAAQQAASFEAEMRNINSIAQLTEDEFTALSGSVLDFGKNTRGGATAAAQALYTVYSAGVMGADAFGIMEVSVKTAEAGLADMTTTTEALTAILLSYGDTSEEAAKRASDALTTMVQLGVGSMQDFAGSVSTYLPAAKSLGVAYEEAFAAQAFLTQRGFSASEAAVRVNAVMRDLIQPTEAMTAAFRELGVSGAEELIEKFGGLSEAVIALAGTTDGTQAELAALFDETRSRQFVTSMVNDVDAWREAYALFMDSMDGATMDAWEQQTQSFAYQWDRLKAAMQAAAIVIGQQILPIITPLVTQITGVFIAISELNPGIIEFGVVAAGAVAAAAPILWLLSSLVSPVGLLIAGVTALARALSTDFAGTISDILNIAPGLREELEGLFKAVEGFVGLVMGVDPNAAPLKGLSESTTEAAEEINKGLTYVVQPGDSLWQIWYDNFRTQFATFEEFIASTQLDPTAIILPGDQIRINVAGMPDISDFDKIIAQAMGNAIQGMEFAASPMGGVVSNMIEGANQAAEDNNTLGARLARGIEEGIPMVLGALRRLLGGIVIWAVTDLFPRMLELGTKALGSLASVFSSDNRGTGSSPLYIAFRELLSGDILGAIQTVLPGFGGKLATELENVDFTAAIDGFKTAAGEFVGAFGDWLVEEGIPVVARSLGYFVGRLGALIGQLMGAVWQALFAPDESGETGIENVGDFAGDVWEEAQAGFRSAMTDAGITSPVDTMFTLLAGALVAPAVISGFLRGLVSRGFGGAIMGAIGGAINAVVTVPTALFSAAKGLLGRVASLFSTIPVPALILGSVIIGGFLSILFDEDARAQLGNALTQVMTDVAEAMGYYDREANAMFAELRATGAEFSELTPQDWGGISQGADQAGLELTLHVTEAEYNRMLDEWHDMYGGLVPFPIRVELVPEGSPQGLYDQYGNLQLGEAGQAIQPLGGMVGFEGAAPDVDAMTQASADAATAVGDSVVVQSAFQEAGQNMGQGILMGMDQAMAQAVANGQAFNAETWVTDLLLPVETQFGRMFRVPDGIIPMLMTAFLTQTAADVQAIIDEYIRLSGGVTNELSAFALNVTTTLDPVVQAFNDLHFAIGNVRNGLQSLAGMAVGITITGEAGSGGGSATFGGETPEDVNGSSVGHYTGLYKTPFDNYPALLHKGEMVLTSQEADKYRAGKVPARMVEQPEREVVTSPAPTINVYGVQDFNSFLQEARRRGIKLG